MTPAIEAAIALLREAGWRLTPPASAPVPTVRAGQVWAPTKPGSTALERRVAYVWQDGDQDVVTYATWDDQRSTITLPAWQSWVRKHAARVVAP